MHNFYSTLQKIKFSKQEKLNFSLTVNTRNTIKYKINSLSIKSIHDLIDSIYNEIYILLESQLFANAKLQS